MADKIHQSSNDDGEFNRCVREAYSTDQLNPFVELKLGVYQWTIKGTLIVIAIAGLVLIVEIILIKKSRQMKISKALKHSISTSWKVLKLIVWTSIGWMLVVIKSPAKFKNRIRNWIKGDDVEGTLCYLQQLRTGSRTEKF